MRFEERTSVGHSSYIWDLPNSIDLFSTCPPSAYCVFELGSGMTKGNHIGSLPSRCWLLKNWVKQTDSNGGGRNGEIDDRYLAWTERGICEDFLEEVMPELSPEDKREMGWRGREAQLKTKGKQDGDSKSLPSRIIFLQDQLEKREFVPKLLLNPLSVCSFQPSALSGCSQCHHGPPLILSPGRSGPISGRLLLRASWQCSRYYCSIGGTWWKWQCRRKYSKLYKIWLFRGSQEECQQWKELRRGFWGLLPFLRSVLPSLLEDEPFFLNFSGAQYVLLPMFRQPHPSDCLFVIPECSLNPCSHNTHLPEQIILRDRLASFPHCSTLCAASQLTMGTVLGIFYAELCSTLGSSVWSARGLPIPEKWRPRWRQRVNS